MTRGGISKSHILLLREAKRVESSHSRFSRTNQSGAAGSSEGVSKSGGKTEESNSWVPHPRTGIYSPEGHEWVMDDVPEGAASFTQTCWFRNVDGTDNHGP